MAVMGSLVVETLASVVVDQFRERRLGPPTPESEALLAEASDLKHQAAKLAQRANSLERQADELRFQARRARPTWFNKNREALLVNVVAGLIVGVPTFLLGVLVSIFLL